MVNTVMRDIKEEKRILRKKYKNQRDSICVEKREMASEKIFENLIAMPEIERANLVLTFISFGSEPDTKEFAEHIISTGKMLAVAKCMTESPLKGIMNFHIISSLSDLEKGSYGILEPKAGILPVSDEEIDLRNTVCIVPGFSFSENGYRLGYGGGYYDRFLSKHRNIKKIGICFDEMLSENIPTADNDIPVDIIVTDKKITEITYG